jgi:hypothetical protein
MENSVLDLTESGEGKVADFFEHANEPLGCIDYLGFLDYLNTY